ncbi:MAG TPA: S8/S53 family peptidase [Myxococcota bacterium]|nr:S8/S53 family peptidase [Myxococcota bacterium]
MIVALWHLHPGADASQGDSEPYLHPLLSPEAQDVIGEVMSRWNTEDPREILSHLAIGAGVRETAPGEAEVFWIIDIVEPDANPQLPPPAAPSPPGVQISRAAADLLEQPLPAAPATFIAAHPRASFDTVGLVDERLEEALLVGDVSTVGEARDAVAALVARKRADGRADAKALAEEIEGLGGEVVGIEPLSGQVTFVASIQDALSIAAMPGLGLLDVRRPPIADAGYPVDTDDPLVTGPYVNGWEMDNEMQANQFYSSGYEGAERVAIVESDANTIFRAHPGFKHGGAGPHAPRIDNCGAPLAGACTTNPSPSDGDEHATAVASIALGNITDSQDTMAVNRVPRSGVARHDRGLGIDWDTGWTSVIASYTDPLARYLGDPIKSVNISANMGLDCSATSAAAHDADAVFESSVAIFKSASNYEHSSTTTCTVGSPAGAPGVFTVGAYRVTGDDEEVINAQSSRGGVGSSSANGASRSIIGAAQISGNAFPYPNSGTACRRYRTAWDTDSCPGNFERTSSATPAVTGADSLLYQWGLDDLGGLMNQPERRYVFLLAMGDRWNGSLYKTSGFSNLWGAGRIRLRKYDADGMDAPAELRFDQFCVPASTDVIRPINDGYALPADAAYIKVVTWWYDPRLESGNTHDKMTLTLQSWDGSAWVDEVTDSSDDTKQMVFLDDAEAVPYRVKVTGRDVTAHHPGCEADEMKVFHQVYWEDNDRDDGPELDLIRPEYLP